ncbi:hypothetical protein K432DRAFT_127413 [Lepidopterella palustris CBS 459.81]|uniref:Uncharacterized protein n=1 Tax=Lepidopterella palustris CBS 459.81 TaxID=1314670 RepID=A0A8E2E4S4_9PEZI|nr:hypothetical protein K432DRAFT_127413 [Lepidopterella palustris CBS 459.81]
MTTSSHLESHKTTTSKCHKESVTRPPPVSVVLAPARSRTLLFPDPDTHGHKILRSLVCP